jgi:ribosomal protein S18 acetylase RimI-like enzyme
VLFTLERATTDDVETLVEFERKVVNPKLYGPALDFESAIKEIEKNTFFFIKIGNAVIGTAAYCERTDKTVYISNVAVDPIYRRQGVAREVVCRILHECSKAPRVELVTHPENENALRLYFSLGFRMELIPRARSVTLVIGQIPIFPQRWLKRVSSGEIRSIQSLTSKHSELAR